MSLETDLVAYLKADAALDVLLGDRIYPFVKSQAVEAVFPQLVYFIASVTRPRVLAGQRSGLTKTRVQLDALGATEAQAEGVAKRVADMLDGARGKLNNTTVVQGAVLDEERGDFDKPSKGEEQAIYRRVLEVIFWHEENVPAATLT